MTNGKETDEHAQSGNEFAAALGCALDEYGIDPLDALQRAKLTKHYLLLRAWNRRINLTRIIEPEEAARLHYADSLFGGRFLGTSERLVDIGSGAGFPAVPLAVLRPDIQVTALEANQRKSVFLREVSDALGLTNLRVVTARVETFDLSAFDVLTSRALDRAENVLPGILERLEVGQAFLLFCAPELLGKLRGSLPAGVAVETHDIPRTEARLVAIFTRK